MESLDRFLAEAVTGDILSSPSEFTVCDTELTRRLAEMGRQKPKLALLHLVQNLYLVPMDGVPALRFARRSGWCLRFRPLHLEHRQAFTPQSVYQHRQDLLGRSLAARTARVLVESGPGAALYSADEPAKGLRVNLDGTLGFDLGLGELKEGEVEVRFSLANSPLSKWMGELEAQRTVSDICGLLPWPLQVGTSRETVATWSTFGEEDELPLWDWESVELSTLGHGFHWLLPCRLDPAVHLHDGLYLPQEKFRNRAVETPLVLHLEEPTLVDRLAQDQRAFSRVAVGRVFGVSWNATYSLVSRIVPIIEGVPGEPLLLPELPRGLFCYADSGGLGTDFTGLQLTLDGRTEAWRADLVDWMRREVSIYRPLIPLLPGLWLARCQQQREGRAPGLVRRGLYALGNRFMTSLYSSSMLKGILERRGAELQRWIEGAV